MDLHDYESNYQADIETVDALLNKDVCEICGNEIKKDWMGDQGGTTADVEIGHDEDCSKAKKYF